MAELVEQDMRIEKVVSGDRPSVLALGLAAAEALKRERMAVFMVDVLGRVCLMPAASVQVLTTPQVHDGELDAMSEDDAIQVMLAQGSGDSEVVQYLKRRNGDAEPRSL